MKLDRRALFLYAITTRNWLNGDKLGIAVEKAIRGGATCIQFREKELEGESLLKEASEIRNLCKKYSIPFIVNDNADLALKVNADGLHIGQNDMDIEIARNIIGKERILGVTANSKEKAILAERRGADYLGVGSVFKTSSKNDAVNIEIERLKEISDAVRIPIVAIGGIDEFNVKELKDNGIAGIAVINAIFNRVDIEGATSKLKNILIEEEIIK
ncbi:MAG: thiamine phosphate synthase [Tissierellia bacterium]|nr:thiamine phosphate synthase [Tissierellia bacterium]